MKITHFNAVNTELSMVTSLEKRRTFFPTGYNSINIEALKLGLFSNITNLCKKKKTEKCILGCKDSNIPQ